MKRFLLIFILLLLFLVACNQKDINWGYNRVILDSEHKAITDDKVKVAILDSGIAKVDGINDSILYAYNTMDDNNITDDQYGHGTMVASILVGKSIKFDKLGINPNVEIYDIQVLDEKGVGKAANVIEGIEKAIEQDVDIINISIGFSNDIKGLQNVIDRAIEKGIIVVASAGNSMGYEMDYPAQYNGVISVSAIDEESNKYMHASGGEVDFVAPGVDVPVINTQNKIEYQSGTSFATAYITGIISLYLEKGETVSKESLQDNSETIIGKEGESYNLLYFK